MPLSIRDVVDGIIGTIPGAPFAETVDTFKTGDPSQPVKGIVTTFLATQAVIEQAATLGANLIITHEPTFYNHPDQIEWLADDPVYQAKRTLIDRHGIVIWRFHDYWHTHRPDGIITGVLKALGWEAYADAEHPEVCTIPALPLDELARYFKAKLGIATVRVIGEGRLMCRRVGISVGFGGGEWVTPFLHRANLDALAVGEIHEWETSEYVRDAVRQGRPWGLIVLGHEPSEEPGMAYLVTWLKQRWPEIPVTHVPAGYAFRYV